MHSLLDVGTLKSRRGKKVHPADHGVVNISAAVTKNTDAAVNVTASTLSIQLSSQQQQQEDAFTSFSNSSSPTAGGAPRRKLNNSNSKHQRGNTLERGVNLRPSNTAAGGLGGDTPNSSWQKTRSALPGSSSSRESLEANFPSGHQKLEFMTEGFKVSSPRGVNFSNIGTSSRLASTHQFNSLIRGNIPDISEFENFNSNTVHSKHSSNGDRTSLVKIPSRNTSSDDSQNNFSTNISRSPLLVKRNPTLTAFDGIDVHDLPLLKPATSAEPSPISGGSPSIPKQQSKNALLGEKLQQRTPSVIRLDGTGKKGPQHIHSPSLPSRLTTPSFQNHPDPTVVAIHEQMMGSLMPLDDMVQPVVKHMLKDGIYGFKEDVPDSMEARLQNQLVEDKIQDMKLGPNPNKPRKRQIKAMGLSEINAMMFYLARRGEHKSLKLLSTIHNLDFNLKDDEGRTALTYAAIGNRRECLEDLLKRGSLADSFDSSGRTALHWASYYGCDVSVEWLVKYRADMTYSDYQGRTCFHCATYPEKSKTLAYLLRKFPAHQHVDFLDEERMTPLMWAAFYGNEENVKLLLKRGASAYLKDIDGKTALHWTSSNRHCNAVRILVEFDPKLAAETDNLGRVPLHLASGEGNVSIVNLLLKLKVTKESIRDNSRRTPLHWAAVRGQVAVVKLLCESKANPNKADHYGASPLHYAAEKNFADCAHVLIKKGAIVDIKDQHGRSPLLWAAAGGNIDSLKILLDTKSDINQRDDLGMTALHLASYAGHIACCLFLIRRGADVDALDINDQTPLFRAVMAGRADVVLALIQEGGNPNFRDVNGRYPLHWACGSGETDIVNILLGSAAEVDGLDNNGISPLNDAAFYGHTSIVNYLIENSSANVNLVDQSGWSALHRAASNGHSETCAMLIQLGAKKNLHHIRGEFGKTPCDLAIENKHTKCALFLKGSGAYTSEEHRIFSALVIQTIWRYFKTKSQRTHFYRAIRVEEAQSAANRLQKWIQKKNDAMEQIMPDNLKSVYVDMDEYNRLKHEMETERRWLEEERKLLDKERKVIKELRGKLYEVHMAIHRNKFSSPQTSLGRQSSNNRYGQFAETGAALMIQKQWKQFKGDSIKGDRKKATTSTRASEDTSPIAQRRSEHHYNGEKKSSSPSHHRKAGSYSRRNTTVNDLIADEESKYLEMAVQREQLQAPAAAQTGGQEINFANQDASHEKRRSRRSHSVAVSPSGSKVVTPKVSPEDSGNISKDKGKAHTADNNSSSKLPHAGSTSSLPDQKLQKHRKEHSSGTQAGGGGDENNNRSTTGSVGTPKTEDHRTHSGHKRSNRGDERRSKTIDFVGGVVHDSVVVGAPTSTTSPISNAINDQQLQQPAAAVDLHSMPSPPKRTSSGVTELRDCSDGIDRKESVSARPRKSMKKRPSASADAIAMMRPPNNSVEVASELRDSSENISAVIKTVTSSPIISEDVGNAHTANIEANASHLDSASHIQPSDGAARSHKKDHHRQSGQTASSGSKPSSGRSRANRSQTPDPALAFAEKNSTSAPLLISENPSSRKSSAHDVASALVGSSSVVVSSSEVEPVATALLTVINRKKSIKDTIPVTVNEDVEKSTNSSFAFEKNDSGKSASLAQYLVQFAEAVAVGSPLPPQQPTPNKSKNTNNSSSPVLSVNPSTVKTPSESPTPKEPSHYYTFGRTPRMQPIKVEPVDVQKFSVFRDDRPLSTKINEILALTQDQDPLAQSFQASVFNENPYSSAFATASSQISSSNSSGGHNKTQQHDHSFNEKVFIRQLILSAGSRNVRAMNPLELGNFMLSELQQEANDSKVEWDQINSAVKTSLNRMLDTVEKSEALPGDSADDDVKRDSAASEQIKTLLNGLNIANEVHKSSVSLSSPFSSSFGQQHQRRDTEQSRGGQSGGDGSGRSTIASGAPTVISAGISSPPASKPLNMKKAGSASSLRNISALADTSKEMVIDLDTNADGEVTEQQQPIPPAMGRGGAGGNSKSKLNVTAMNPENGSTESLVISANQLVAVGLKPAKSLDQIMRRAASNGVLRAAVVAASAAGTSGVVSSTDEPEITWVAVTGHEKSRIMTKQLVALALQEVGTELGKEQQ